MRFLLLGTRATSDMESETKTKTCFRCDRTQPLVEFYRHRRMADKRLNKCRTCTKADTAAWRVHNRQHMNDLNHRRYNTRLHGLSVEEYDALYDGDPTCPGCGRTQERVGRRHAIDHCHTTGKVRGLLCAQCNLAVGNVSDDPTVLRRLAEYLEASCP